MPVENTRSLAGNALAYLEARPGQKFSAVVLSREFGCCDHTMRARLNDLSARGKIRKLQTDNGFVYWAREQLEQAGMRERIETGRQYVMPATMRERAVEAQAHRERFPSRHI